MGLKMIKKAKPEIVEDVHLEFLDELREPGTTNMIGAGPYLRREFGVTGKEAHEILRYWMCSFSERNGA